ncbi:MAG TPA: hypothetical protein VLB07_00595, partial [Woeseiaceae bacterium]|nr:hypothetical protein [Woeseiaceae bacterium]
MTDKDMTDDERLSAWLDGELPRGEAMRLEERLAAEPPLARRLERMREAGRKAQQAFHAIDETPLPQSVLDLLKDDGADRLQDTEGAKIVRLQPRAPRFFQVPVAIAASVALVAGFLVHDLLTPQGSGESVLPMSGMVAGDSGLYQLLEKTSAGETVRLPDDGNGEVVLTFQGEDGDWCRQFRLGSATADLYGLACRQPGGWQLETASFAGPSGA